VLPNGDKIKSAHSYELVAAYFGYKSYSALRADHNYPLRNIESAEYVFPEITKLELRTQQFYGTQVERYSYIIARHISDFLSSAIGLQAKIWICENLEEMIVAELVHAEFSNIEDAVSGEMATTNAYYDELYFEEASVFIQQGVLSFTTDGDLNGEQDWDRAFYGDKINISIAGTMEQVSGTTCFTNLKMEIDGAVDHSHFAEG